MSEGITLKPIKGNICTYPRSPIPTFLADAGVPQEVWSASHDAAVQHNNHFCEIENHAIKTAHNNFKTSCTWCFLPAFVTFIAIFGISYYLFDRQDYVLATFAMVLMLTVPFWVGPMVGGYCSRGPDDNDDSETSTTCMVKWRWFVDEQKSVYRPFGIDCQTSNERHFLGTLLTLNMAAINFLPLRPKTAASAGGNVSPQQSVAIDLESLCGLHQSGALTDEEYTQAKACVLILPSNSCNNLSSSSSPSDEIMAEARAVMAESEPTCAYAQAIQDLEVGGGNNTIEGPNEEKTSLLLV